MIDTETLRADLKTHMTESVGEAVETTLKDRIFPMFEALFDQIDAADEASPISEELAEILLRVISDSREMAANLLAQIPADAPNRDGAVNALTDHVNNCDAALQGLAEIGIEIDTATDAGGV